MVKQDVRLELAIISAIAEARRQANVSKRALSVQLGEALNFMQKIECGDRTVTVLDFVRIARALKVDPCKLFARAVRE